MFTEGHSSTSSLTTTTSQQQNQISQTNQLHSNYKTPSSISNRSGFTSPSSLMTQNSQSLIPPLPFMERSNSASTMSSNANPFHEKSPSTVSIQVNLNNLSSLSSSSAVCY